MKRLMVAAVLVSLLAGACGEEGPAGPRPRVRVAVGPFMNTFPLHLARERGLFAAEGLDVEFVEVPLASELAVSLVQGEIEVLAGAISPQLINAVARGASIKAVATLGKEDPDAPCDQTEFLVAADVLDSGQISEPADLAGRKVLGREVGFTGYLIDLLLNEANLTIDDVEIVPVGPTDVMQKFGRDGADVMPVSDPFRTRLVESGRARPWRAASELAPNLDTSVIMFGPGLLEDDFDAGERFMRAYVRALEAYADGKTDENMAAMSALTGLDPELVRKACWPEYGDGSIDWEPLVGLQRYSLRRGHIDRELTEEEFLDDGFIDRARASR